VILPVDVSQPFIGYMGIDLRGADVPVAQKFLNYPQINPLVQEVCGHAVP